MSSEQISSKGKLKYFSPQGQVIPKCPCCQKLSKKLDTLLEILSEHIMLLDRIASQNVETDKLMSILPVTSEEKLKLDGLLAMHSDPYIRQIKNLIGGSVERNLHLVLSHYIIMNFNIEGSFGKNKTKGLWQSACSYNIISTFNNKPDKILRAAFQRQKKKYFKQISRKNSNSKLAENVQET